MDESEATIRQIHSSPHRVVLAVTGGGSVAISHLLSVPGASKTVLEVVVPYAANSLAEWLGSQPDQSCSPETALAMAAVAFQRAERLAGDTADPLLGLGCTASIVSDRPKQGDHRCYVATQTATTTGLYTLVLEKGHRDRRSEDHVVGSLVLRGLAEACNLQQVPEISLIDSEEITVDWVEADPLLADVRSGRSPLIWSMPSGELLTRLRQGRPRGILSGSFNPLHDGHIALRSAAEKRLQGTVEYELSILNADKPPLDFITIERRRRQFTDRPILLTAAATFVEKANHFPGTAFVIGVDTAERVVDPRFYGEGKNAVRKALESIHRRNCQFLVAGRYADDTFRTLSAVSIPEGYEGLFQELPERMFRSDMSSTGLRKS